MLLPTVVYGGKPPNPRPRCARIEAEGWAEKRMKASKQVKRRSIGRGETTAENRNVMLNDSNLGT